MDICHLTSVHSRYDTRIFLKECRSLVSAGYQVSLVVADGRGDEVKDDVSIFDVGVSRNRIGRMYFATRRIFKKAKAQHADIYHLHDPELIPVGLKLKKLGNKVIFDAHEDVPEQLRSKPYLSVPARWFLSRIFAAYEAWACKHFDAIVTATPFIRDKFLEINPNSVDINNFPILGELVPVSNNWGARRKEVCYVGGITAIRGIKEVIRALELVKSGVRLKLAGRFAEQDVENEVKNYKGWSNVDELGIVDRNGVRDILEQSIAGLVTFIDVPNHINAQPNKMFEYMSAGIPVIASNFPLWRGIVEGNDCGVCVNPLDHKEIAEAIEYLMGHPDEAEQMGKNGRKAVLGKYNWEKESEKLLKLYEEL